MSFHEWQIEFTQHKDAIRQAVDAFAAHLRQLPGPESADDTEALLHWRASVFQLPPEPAGQASINNAAARMARNVQAILFSVESGAQEMLASVETMLTICGRSGLAGVVGLGAFPENVLRCEFGNFVAYVGHGLFALPFDHPVFLALEDDEIPADKRIRLGAGETTFAMDGTPRTHFPPWMALSHVRQLNRAVVAKARRKAEEAEQLRGIEERLARVFAESSKTPEQRKIEALERDLAAVKAQLAEQEEPVPSVA